MKLVVLVKTKGKTYEKSITYPLTIEKCKESMLSEDAKVATVELYNLIIKELFGRDEVEGYELVPEIRNDKMIEEFENESDC